MSDAPPEVPMVTITRARFERLYEAYRLLSKLEEWGVDNWDGYGHARQALRQEDENEENDD